MQSQHIDQSASRKQIERQLPSLRIVWPAMRSSPDAGGVPHLARVAFTLAVDVLDDQHAMIEAWTESPDHRGTVFHRQPVRCEIAHDDRFLHLDAIGDDGGRWLRLTISADESGDQLADDARPVFAQCSLLAHAGFVAGTFDPPTLHLQPIAEVTAATA